MLILVFLIIPVIKTGYSKVYSARFPSQKRAQQGFRVRHTLQCYLKDVIISP